MFKKIRKELRETIQSLAKAGTFSQNIIITTTGSTTAYLLGFLLSPLLARVYEPEAYGLFALFNALVVNLGIFATLDYTNAFLLPSSRIGFRSLVQLALFLIAITALVTAGVLIMFQFEILEFFNAGALGDLVFLVPLAVAITSINRCLDQWNNREKQFRQGAKAKVVTIVGAKLFTLGYGVLSKGNPLGFIAGELVGRILTIYAQIGKKIRANLSELYQLSVPDTINVAREYRNYPLFNLPANAMISLGSQLPVYLLSLQFSAAITGHYSLAISLISAPTLVVGASIAQVFFQKGVETYRLKPHELGTITRKLFRRLIVLAALPFGVIGVFGEQIFMVVFGSNWQMAGIFAGFLSIMAYFNFVSISICSLYRIIRAEKLRFFIVLTGALLLTGLLLVPHFNSAGKLVLLYSLVSSLIQIVMLAFALYKTGISPFRPIAEMIICYVIGFSCCYILADIIL